MWIATPVVEIFVSTRASARGSVPPAKRRFPLPTDTGKTHSCSSSTRSCASSVWMRSPLPCTWISSPADRFSRATASATSACRRPSRVRKVPTTSLRIFVRPFGLSFAIRTRSRSETHRSTEHRVLPKDQTGSLAGPVRDLLRAHRPEPAGSLRERYRCENDIAMLCDTPPREPPEDSAVAEGTCPARGDCVVSLRLDPAADADESVAYARPMRGRKPSAADRRGQAAAAARSSRRLVRLEHWGKCGPRPIGRGLLPTGGRTFPTNERVPRVQAGHDHGCEEAGHRRPLLVPHRRGWTLFAVHDAPRRHVRCALRTDGH